MVANNSQACLCCYAAKLVSLVQRIMVYPAIVIGIVQGYIKWDNKKPLTEGFLSIYG